MMGQTLIASAGYLVIQDALRTVHPLTLVTFRFGGAALLLYAMSKLTGHLAPVPWRAHRQFMLLGLLGVTLNQSMFFLGLAQPGTQPEHAAMLYAMTGGFAYLAGLLLGTERWRLVRVSGILLAITGASWVLVDKGVDFASGSANGYLILFVAVIFWALYGVLGFGAVRAHGPLRTTTWAMVYGALFYSPYGAYRLWTFDWTLLTPNVLLALAWLIILTSGASFYFWYYALTRLEPSQVALFTTLQPPLTALLAWMFMGTPITLTLVLGMALVIAGVRLSQKG
ncbi:MAG: hypothetical protein GMKNLPBB_02829 [Myxococcota bacterium]|nr:hypothetical protein [Myxococcota bacterium]